MPRRKRSPSGYIRELMGVSEIAAHLGVSRQRADQLSRNVGFPEPVRLVIPIPADTSGAADAIAAVAPTPEKPRTAAELLELMVDNAYELPEQPRLWLRFQIERWAEARDA